MKMELKDHVCSDACHEAGHCVMIHGEKGHKCSAECKMAKADEKAMDLKDHVCSDACKAAGHCVMAHGEKGHTCSEACHSKM